MATKYRPCETIAVNEAIESRGGHCRSCDRCVEITAVPTSLGMRLTSDNLSVRVRCKLDQSRIYPFQSETKEGEDCPVLRRHIKRQTREAEQI